MESLLLNNGVRATCELSYYRCWNGGEADATSATAYFGGRQFSTHLVDILIVTQSYKPDYPKVHWVRHP